METFSTGRFRNDAAARAYLEQLRWPDGPVVPALRRDQSRRVLG